MYICGDDLEQHHHHHRFITAPDYMPNDQVVFRYCFNITGITETTFMTGALTHRRFDVGDLTAPVEVLRKKHEQPRPPRVATT